MQVKKVRQEVFLGPRLPKNNSKLPEIIQRCLPHSKDSILHPRDTNMNQLLVEERLAKLAR
jgi:hypothetical protein